MEKKKTSIPAGCSLDYMSSHWSTHFSLKVCKLHRNTDIINLESLWYTYINSDSISYDCVVSVFPDAEISKQLSIGKGTSTGYKTKKTRHPKVVHITTGRKHRYKYCKLCRNLVSILAYTNSRKTECQFAAIRVNDPIIHLIYLSLIYLVERILHSG